MWAPGSSSTSRAPGWETPPARRPGPPRPGAWARRRRRGRDWAAQLRAVGEREQRDRRGGRVRLQALRDLLRPQPGQHPVQDHGRGHEPDGGLHRVHAVGDLVGAEALLLRPPGGPRGASSRRPRPPAPGARASGPSPRRAGGRTRTWTLRRPGPLPPAGRRAPGRSARRCRGPGPSPGCPRSSGRGSARTAGRASAARPRARCRCRGPRRARWPRRGRAPPPRARDRRPGEYLAAFETRFSITSARRSRSAQHGTGSSGMSTSTGCRSSAGMRASTSRTTAARSTRPNSNGNCPISRRVVFRVLSTSLAMWVADWMMDRACCSRSSSGASGLHSRSSAWPSTPASGARKSWATMFTSSLFMRSSSTSRAFVRSTAW